MSTKPVPFVLLRFEDSRIGIAPSVLEASTQMFVQRYKSIVIAAPYHYIFLLFPLVIMWPLSFFPLPFFISLWSSVPAPEVFKNPKYSIFFFSLKSIPDATISCPVSPLPPPPCQGLQTKTTHILAHKEAQSLRFCLLFFHRMNSSSFLSLPNSFLRKINVSVVITERNQSFCVCLGWPPAVLICLSIFASD